MYKIHGVTGSAADNFMVSNFQFPLPELDTVIQSLESFQRFSPSIRATAIALRAKELGIGEMHFYRVAALLVEFGGGR